MTTQAAYKQSEQACTSVSFDARRFRDAMSHFATGVVVVTTTDDEGEVHAMTANAFMSVSLEPPLVVVSIAKTARMHEKVHAHRENIGISILAQDQQFASGYFAGQFKDTELQAPQVEKLGSVSVLTGAVTQLETELHDIHPCGDHSLVVVEVKRINIMTEMASPLLFHRGKYCQLVQKEE